VLDALAEHPATARFVCTKLVRWLVGDPVPEAAVARATGAFRGSLAAPDQIARTVRAILAGPEIADPQLGRMRRPLDAVAAAARAYAVPLAPNPALLGQMAAAGQVPFGWPAPDGQPLNATQYDGAGALRTRWGLLLAIARNGFGTGASPLFEGMAGQPVAETVAGIWLAAGRPDPASVADVAELAGWVLAAPAFQRV